MAGVAKGSNSELQELMRRAVEAKHKTQQLIEQTRRLLKQSQELAKAYDFLPQPRTDRNQRSS